MPHLHDKIDFTVSIFIVYKDKVLLRKHEKYNRWLAVGGHVELDEDPNQAAVREAKEEVGLDVTLWHGGDVTYRANDYTELIPPQFLNRHRVTPSHEHVDLSYFATTESDQVVETDKEKSNGIAWLSQEDLLSQRGQIDHQVIQYALAALGALGKI